VAEVFLSHDEQLEVGLEEGVPHTLRVLLAVLSDYAIEDNVHHGLHVDAPKVQDRQIVIVLGHNCLDFLGGEAARSLIAASVEQKLVTGR
jgi:hypothetical protein